MRRYLLSICLAVLASISTVSTVQAETVPTEYSSSLKAGTEDASAWTISPGLAPEGATVTATYSGSKVVETVRAMWPASGQVYDYTGTIQTFTAPSTGIYELRVWGAQGGNRTHSDGTLESGGRGGFASCRTSLAAGETLYIYVGGQGENIIDKKVSDNTGGAGGWNGGGNGGTGWDIHNGAAGGGGATHISKVNNQVIRTNVNSLAGTDYIIVAGGGGGAGHPDSAPGAGGGTTGGFGKNSLLVNYSSNWYWDTHKSYGKDGGNSGEYNWGQEGSGGGGGGFYGGNANTNHDDSSDDSGGCGGNSYFNRSLASGFSTTDDQREGNGMAEIVLVSHATTEISTNHYQYIMPASNVEVEVEYGFVGSGTEGDPYLIASADDWNLLADNVNAGKTYEGKYFRQTADFTITTMVGATINADGGELEDEEFITFNGTYDGAGHTLNLNLNVTGERYVGPFHCVSNATIKNLVVTGSVTVGGGMNVDAPRHPAALIGCCRTGSCVIENCLVSANVSGADYMGGLIGHSWFANVTITGSVYSGTLTSTGGNYTGGLIGWGGDNGGKTFVITDCLFAGTYAGTGKFHPVGCLSSTSNTRTLTNIYYTTGRKNMSDDDSHSFVRYLTDKGKQAYSITSGEGITVANAGEATVYDVSGITGYGTGIKYNGVLYGGLGDELSLTLGGSHGGYVVSAGSLSGSSNPYTLTMAEANAQISMLFAGSGTEDDPYLIASVEKWNLLVSKVNTGTSYAGKYFRQTADISVTTMVGASDSKPFSGTYDGAGHTLTVTYTATAIHSGPFRYVRSGTIKNLHTAGTLTTSYKAAGGIIGHVYEESTIINCRSSVEIHSSINGDGTHGGLIGSIDGSNSDPYKDNIIEGCVFDGRFIGNTTTCWGGFVGWCSDNTHVSLYSRNNLFIPQELTINTSGCQTISRASHVDVLTITNTYCSQTIGGAQGKQRYSITSIEGITVANAGEATVYDVSGITGYGTGIKYNGVLYGGPGDELSLTLGGSDAGYEVSAGSLSGSSNPYTLTMAEANAQIVLPFDGSGTEGDPYLIASVEKWNLLVSKVNTGTSYAGMYFRQTADISVTTMVGASDSKPFSGTYDGAGHTLTVDITNNAEETTAPFRFIQGATIRNLHVSGSITTNRKYAGSIAGRAICANTIINCISDISLTSTITGDGTHGGIIGLAWGTCELDTTLIEGCVFNGKLLGGSTYCCGGFSGWCTDHENIRLAIRNCLFLPQECTFNPAYCQTFSRANDLSLLTISNCYYSETLGEEQGKQLRSITAADGVTVANAGTPTEYTVSGITAYGTGVLYSGVLYGGEGDELSLNLSGSPYGLYAESSGTLNGSGNPYTLSMSGADCVISELFPEATITTSSSVTTPYLTFSSALAAWEANSTLTLLADVTTGSTITVSNNSTLDLNGHGIKMTGSGSVIFVASDKTLTLNDSDPNITHKFSVNESTLLAALDEENGELTINGGYITGGTAQFGCGVLINRSARLVMNGGTVIGNATTDATDSYGAICVSDQGEYVAHFDMNGGAICYNAAKGVRVQPNTYATINGGSIHHNNDVGVQMHAPNGVTLNNAVIQYNTKCGVQIDTKYTQLQIQGRTIITNNTLNNNPCDIYFSNSTSSRSKALVITGALDSEACIGIGGSYIPNPFTSGLSGHGNASNFYSNIEGYSVKINGNGEAFAARCASITNAPSPISGLVANGTAQTLITAGASDEGSMYYSLDNINWSTDLPEATEYGYYTVYYRVAGDATHADNPGASFKVLVASYKEGTIEGAISGAYSISANQRVYLSQGNLQYQPSSGTYRFAAHQYEAIGTSNSQISPTYDGWVDYFCWGTGDEPTKVINDNSAYDLFTDWGISPISNGDNQAYLWRTLTHDEWKYIISQRPNAGKKWSQATVGDMHGVVLLPDDWTLPEGLNFTPQAFSWSTNNYTTEQWAQMEEAGAIFMPAVGSRQSDLLPDHFNEWGSYWSSSRYSSEKAYNVWMHETHFSADDEGTLDMGAAVRLATAAIHSVTWKDGNGETLKTDVLTYGEMPEYTGAAPTKTATAEYTYTFNNTWSPSIVAVTADATYTAQFDATPNAYTLAWVLDGGTVTTAGTPAGSVNYGAELTAPVVEKTGYTFAGWSPAVPATMPAEDIELTAQWTINQYTVKFMNGDEVLQSSLVEYGAIPAYNGETPTKEADAQYAYSFAGWDADIVAVSGETTYNATFTPTKRSYTVTWLNDDDSQIDQTEVEYGVVPTHANPSKAATAQYTYTFTGWTPEVVSVTGAATYKATFSSTVNKYTVTIAASENGSVDVASVADVPYGTAVAVNGNLLTIGETVVTATPATQTDEYTYAFVEWADAPTSVTGATTVTATFAATTRRYVITFKDEDGTVLSAEAWEYGTIPECAEPTKDATFEYTYTFNGWNPEVTLVTGEATYTATYEATERPHDPTSIDNVLRDDIPCTKFLRDGMLYIMYKGTYFNALGQPMR